MARESKETFFLGICTGKLKLEHLLDLYSCRLSIMREESWVLSMKSRLWIFTNILLSCRTLKTQHILNGDVLSLMACLSISGYLSYVSYEEMHAMYSRTLPDISVSARSNAVIMWFNTVIAWCNYSCPALLCVKQYSYRAMCAIHRTMYHSYRMMRVIYRVMWPTSCTMCSSPILKQTAHHSLLPSIVTCAAHS